MRARELKPISFSVTRTYADIPLAETNFVAVDPVRGFGHIFLSTDQSILNKLANRLPGYTIAFVTPPVLKKLRKLGIPSYAPPQASATSSSKDVTDYTK